MERERAERRRERRERPKDLSMEFNGFMTEKEKEFVSRLFERACRKKRSVSPDFYNGAQKAGRDNKEYVEKQDELGLAAQLRKMGADSKGHKSGEREKRGGSRMFEGALGKATKKSVKGTRVVTEGSSSPFTVRRRILSRLKIEEAHDLLNMEEVQARREMRDGADRRTAAGVKEKLSEIGEDMFNTEKGLRLAVVLLEREQDRLEYSRCLLDVLIDRSKYVTANKEFKSFLGSFIPHISQSLNEERFEGDLHILADHICYNLTGVLLGNVLLCLMLEKGKFPSQPASAKFKGLFLALSKAILECLRKKDGTRGVFSFTHGWQLLLVLSKGLSGEETAQLFRCLKPSIEEVERKGTPQLKEAMSECIKALARKIKK